MKLSDLDLDIPSNQSDIIKQNLVKGSVRNKRGDLQPHPAGIYFYKSIPSFENVSVNDYKYMESINYQKVDILNNTHLNDITNNELENYIQLIDDDNIDWQLYGNMIIHINSQNILVF